MLWSIETPTLEEDNWQLTKVAFNPLVANMLIHTSILVLLPYCCKASCPSNSWKKPRPLCSEAQIKANNSSCPTNANSWKKPRPLCSEAQIKVSNSSCPMNANSWKKPRPLCSEAQIKANTSSCPTNANSWKKPIPICSEAQIKDSSSSGSLY